MNAYSHPPQSRLPSSQRGFNLLELLVVISIIGILAGLLYPAVTRIMLQTKMNRAENAAQNLKLAIKTYYTEYGRLPLEGSGSSEADQRLQSDRNLMDILCASETEAALKANPRRTVFYTGRSARPLGQGRYHSGVHIGSDGAAELFDPWGEPYRVILDGNANGRVDRPFWDHRNPSSEIFNTVLVWSAGPDQLDDSEEEDNVKTW